MADETSSTSVGGVSVDITANLTPFERGLNKGLEEARKFDQVASAGFKEVTAAVVALGGKLDLIQTELQIVGRGALAAASEMKALGTAATATVSAIDRAAASTTNLEARARAAATALSSAQKRGVGVGVAPTVGVPLSPLAPSAPKKIVDNLENADSKTKSLLGSTAALTKQIYGVAAAYAAFEVGKGFLDLLDTTNRLNQRLTVITKSSEDAATAFAAITQTAMTTGQPIETVTTLYTRMALATQELNISQAQLARVTESVAKAVAISGATSTEAAQGIIQFTQALALGRFQGQDLKAVLEDIPGLGNAIVAGLKIVAPQLNATIGNLRQLGSEGKLTADLILNAFLATGAQVDETFTKVPQTIAQAWERVKNDVLLDIKEMNERTDISSNIKETLDELAKTVSSDDFKTAIRGIGELFAWVAEQSAKAVASVGELINLFKNPSLSGALTFIYNRTLLGQISPIKPTDPQTQIDQLQQNRQQVAGQTYDQNRVRFSSQAAFEKAQRDALIAIDRKISDLRLQQFNRMGGVAGIHQMNAQAQTAASDMPPLLVTGEPALTKKQQDKIDTTNQEAAAQEKLAAAYATSTQAGDAYAKTVDVMNAYLKTSADERSPALLTALTRLATASERVTQAKTIAALRDQAQAAQLTAAGYQAGGKAVEDAAAAIDIFNQANKAGFPITLDQAKALLTVKDAAKGTVEELAQYVLGVRRANQEAQAAKTLRGAQDAATSGEAIARATAQGPQALAQLQAKLRVYQLLQQAQVPITLQQVLGNEKLDDTLKTLADTYGQLDARAVKAQQNATVAAGVQTSRNNIEQMQLALRYGDEESAQYKIQLALLQKKQELLAQNITLQSNPVAYKAALAQAQAETEVSIALDKHRQVVSDLHDLEEQTFNDFSQAMVNIATESGSAAKAFQNAWVGALTSVLNAVMKLAVVNPLLNSVLGGGHRTTLDDLLSGGGGLLGALLPSSYGTFGSQTYYGQMGEGDALGGLTGFMHAGGEVGRSGRFVHDDPALYVHAPRLHQGLMADEYRAILQKGETVLPRGAGLGGGTVVNIIDQRGAGAPPVEQKREKRSDGQTQITLLIRSEVGKLMASGQLDGAQRAAYGTRRQPQRVE